MAAGYRKEISVLRYKCILDKVEESYLFEKIEHVVSIRGMRKVGKRCIASIDISFVPWVDYGYLQLREDRNNSYSNYNSKLYPIGHKKSSQYTPKDDLNLHLFVC